ncbi:helix-turn-helix domain-containing protein [Nocardia asiatica]|uniref:helix-turn-helix domain-containing protein n=1 Tax=Nocardia asiatica TaxID=209252 RepID=UPI0006875F2C|nr:helix-turn-helix domain-containing protein [Nocardia asiatica]
MAIAHMQSVFDAEGLTASEKILLLAMANYTDAHGYCRPGMERLCLMTGLSKATIIRTRTALEERNLLRHKRRTNTQGRSTTNRYRINLDKLREMAAPKREFDDDFSALEFDDEPATAAAAAPAVTGADQPMPDPDTPADQAMSHGETPEGVTLRPGGSQRETQSLRDPLQQPGMQRGAPRRPRTKPACVPAGSPSTPPPAAAEPSTAATDPATDPASVGQAQQLLRAVRVQGRPVTGQVIRQHAPAVARLLDTGWLPEQLRSHLEQECAGGRLTNPMGRLVKAITDTPPWSVEPSPQTRPQLREDCDECAGTRHITIVDDNGDIFARRCPNCHPAAAPRQLAAAAADTGERQR